MDTRPEIDNLYVYKDVNQPSDRKGAIAYVTGVKDIFEAYAEFRRMGGKLTPNIVVEILRYSCPEHRARFETHYGVLADLTEVLHWDNGTHHPGNP